MRARKYSPVIGTVRAQRSHIHGGPYIFITIDLFESRRPSRLTFLPGPHIYMRATIASRETAAANEHKRPAEVRCRNTDMHTFATAGGRNNPHMWLEHMFALYTGLWAEYREHIGAYRAPTLFYKVLRRKNV